MAEIRQLRCPTCGAGVDVPAGATRATCEYCRSTLAVEVSQGEASLHAVAQIAGAVEQQGQRTQDALRRMELTTRRAQLVQDFTTARQTIEGIDAELRAIQRAKRTRVTKQQAQHLQSRRQEVARHIGWLQHEIGMIDAELNPRPAAQAVAAPPLVAPPPRARGQNGCLVAIVALFLFGVAISVIGYLSPVVIIGALTLVVLAWLRPGLVDRLAHTSLALRLPEGARATPKRFALTIAAVLIPLSIFLGAIVYGPGGVAWSTPARLTAPTPQR